MSAEFTVQDKEDLREIFRLYDFSKVNKIDDTVALARKAGQTPVELFDDLYQLFKIQKLSQRDAVAKRMREAVPNATDADIESVIRESEMKGLTESDALRSLERKYNVQRLSRRALPISRGNHSSPECNVLENSELRKVASSLHHIKVNETCVTSTSPLATSGEATENTEDSSLMLTRPTSKLSAAPTRENMDEITAEEMRDWVAKIVGPAYNQDVLSTPSFIDTLRTGFLLHVLLQKLESPPVSDENLKLPKRTTGFFVRDNVATFLTTAKQRYDLVDAQLFTVSDLVDGKNDRQVVTCLMSIARIAYSAGTIKDAPSIIVYEHEIEQRQNRLTRLDLDRIVQEAEEDEGMSDLLARQDEPAKRSSNKMDSVPAPTSATVSLGNELQDVVTPPRQEAPDACETALKQDELTSPELAVEERLSSHVPGTQAVTDMDKSNEKRGEDKPEAAAAPTLPVEHTPLRRSPSLDSMHPLSASGIGYAAEPSVLPAPSDVGEDSLPGSVSMRHASPTNEQRTPSKDDEELAAGAQRTAVSLATETTEQKTEAGDTHVSDAAPSGGGGSGEENINGGGRVFYLRNGVIHPAQPTPIEEKVSTEHRKKAGPRIVWKNTSIPLDATQPPRYHSRHWDGIDLALGRHLNIHYEKHPQSHWRFRTVLSMSGEYVLYNRLSGSRRVVFLRIIQNKLLLRNTGKHQRWIEIDEALDALEKSEG